MNYECLGDRILIKPKPVSTTSATGLALPQTEQKQDPMGEVIAVGTGVPLHNITLKIEGTATEAVMEQIERVVTLIEKGREIRVKPGDIVHYGQYAGTKVKIEGVEYLMIRDADVFGRIPK